jgi:hypothetical protein
MSLVFGANATDVASKTSPTSLTALPECSIIVRVNVTTLTTQRNIWSAGGDVAGSWFLRLSGTAGDVQVAQTGTGNLSYITNDTPLAGGAAWIWLMATTKLGTAGHIYAGTLNALLAERMYGTSANGSGTPTPDSGTVKARLGNNASSTGPVQGSIDFVQLYDRILTLAEGQYIQTYRNMLSGCKGFYLPGYEGGSSVVDHSGTGNDLTITGATVGGSGPARAPGMML